MRRFRSAAVPVLGLLVSLLPMSAPAVSALTSTAPAASPAHVTVHRAKLDGVDPGKYGGSVAAALVAYWTPARQRQAEANTRRAEQSAKESRTSQPASKAKAPVSRTSATMGTMATDPASSVALPPGESRKIGKVLYKNVNGLTAYCTAFLLPRGTKAGVIQTAAHCAMNSATGEENTNHVFIAVGAATDTNPSALIFPVTAFATGDWDPESRWGVNKERDYAFMELAPNTSRETTEHLGSLEPAWGSLRPGMSNEAAISGYVELTLNLRSCYRKLNFGTDSFDEAYWAADRSDLAYECHMADGMSGGPVMMLYLDPCGDEPRFVTVGNLSANLPGLIAAGPWNSLGMKGDYELIRGEAAGAGNSRIVADGPQCAGPSAGPGAVGPDLSYFNRSAPVAGMPDWSKAGYLGGEPLPGDSDVTGDESCRVTPGELATKYGVIADDLVDDTSGLQKAVDDVKTGCTPQAGYHRLSEITLPAGRIDVSRQVYVDASFLILQGQGAGDGGTRITFRPDENTRYDTVAYGRWSQDSMLAGSGNDVGTGGWIWPGRGMFRVQTRDMAERYKDDWAAAPANRKDIFEGSINQHWASGIKVVAKAGDEGYSARRGEKLVRLDAKADMKKFTLGGYVWVGAANSVDFYHQQGVGDEDASLMENLHMRQEMFHVAAIDSSARTITVDRPLEYDLPVDSTSDGSAPLFGTVYASKVTPLKVVEGVGFQDFSFAQDMNGLPKLSGGLYDLDTTQAVHNYGNMAPEYAMHGIVFKWAANDWVRNTKATMTGSHPIVTEDALNLQIERNSFDGAWNKGKGGNGYLRGSRVWNSLYAYNLSRNLRHFTFQWSASGNVAFRNDLDSDLNLHGGWERYNLFEQNTVRVPYDHRSASCETNCGGEGGEIDDGTWFPIWWAAGPKAVKWSGSSGPQNVFYNNIMTKQTTPDGFFEPYTPYGFHLGTAYQFGSSLLDPTQFQPLTQNGQPIPDWTNRETVDYTAAHGVVERDMGGKRSLFLQN